VSDDTPSTLTRPTFQSRLLSLFGRCRPPPMHKHEPSGSNGLLIFEGLGAYQSLVPV
jgi:hypothetical protein